MFLSKTGIPIVFFHEGASDPTGSYLRIVLEQAVLASPNSDVILLTDECRNISPGVLEIETKEFEEYALRFKEYYIHVSVNDESYELRCYLRWFYLRALCKRIGCERVAVFDSDVMLYSSMETLGKDFDGYICGNWAWANIFTLGGLVALCEFFEMIFGDLEKLNYFANAHGIYLGRPHTSDMHLLLEFGNSRSDVLHQNTLLDKGFDENMNKSQDGRYLMANDIKLLTMVGRTMPKAKRVDTGETVPFHFLHFQGVAKQFIKAFAWEKV